MANLTGTGTLTLNGLDSRIYDMSVTNDGGLVSLGDGARIENCDFIDAPVDIQGDGSRMAFCRVGGFSNVGVNVDANSCVVEGNDVNMNDADQAAAKGILINSGSQNRVIGNNVWANSLTQVGEACIEADGDYQVIIGNTVWALGGVIGILCVGGDGEITGNTILHSSAVGTGSGGYGVALGSFAIGVTVANNYIVDSQVGIGFLGSAAQGVSIVGNYIFSVNTYGILNDNGSDDLLIEGNYIDAPGGATSNTYDAIETNGDRAFITGNKLRPDVSVTRYGVNVAGGDCNIVVGNDLGDATDYGTDALNDSGTNTQLTYPNDPTYGDNFTACATSA